MKHSSQILERVNVPEKVYHVVGEKRFAVYKQHNLILPVVRAWETLEDAILFAKRTSRTILITIPTKDITWHRLEGHQHKAIITRNTIYLNNVRQEEI